MMFSYDVVGRVRMFGSAWSRRATALVSAVMASWSTEVSAILL